MISTFHAMTNFWKVPFKMDDPLLPLISSPRVLQYFCMSCSLFHFLLKFLTHILKEGFSMRYIKDLDENSTARQNEKDEQQKAFKKRLKKIKSRMNQRYGYSLKRF